MVNTHAQPGCTDPQANNYDSNALTNDGSCTYDLTEYSMTEVTVLPDDLNECSGVEWLSSGLWIHNDAGNEDKIYRIDSTNGAILQSVTIATADNIDWEDITEDEDYIYVGDFGNNAGNRTNLKVHRISKTDLSNNIVNAEEIDFEYGDQTDFSQNLNNNDFDCEAFIFFNDSLHFFTKNWVNNQTKHYVIPATPGSHTAELVETFNVAGLITGADISSNGEIVLIGYTEFGINFMWLLFDYQESLFFSGNKRRISLGTGLTNSQTEGITLRDDGSGYVCSEEFEVTSTVILPQKLLSFSIQQWLDNTTSLYFEEMDNRFSIYPNPFQDYFEVELSRPIEYWALYDLNGRNLKAGSVSPDQDLLKINTQNLEGGLYFLELKKEGAAKTIKLLKL